MGASAGQALGWMVGADGRHEPVLERPTRNGGPNWHQQSNLQGLSHGKSAQPGFKVKLPRVVHGVQRPAASTWPPAEGSVTAKATAPGARKKPAKAGRGR